MSRATALVATTIFEPTFVEGYLQNIAAFNRVEEASLIIVGDKKTPRSVWEVAAAARQRGFNVQCPELDEQEAFLRKLGIPEAMIPFNTDNRRNIGYLMALEQGCQVLVSLDDDNFCLGNDVDFVGTHQVVGTASTDPVVTTSDGWFNICDLLSGWAGEAVYPRGFPYAAQRAARTVHLQQEPSRARPSIGMNAGLWLDEPDVDAVYRLCRHPKVAQFSGQNVLLDVGTWSPVNTQNTALSREFALTYYYVKMGFALKGLSIDRFGDILSGYLTQKVVKHLGQAVRVGTPIVDHRRTPHNLFKDLYHELAGIVLIEDFLPWLRELKLTGGDSLSAYESLARLIAEQAPQFRGFIWDDGGRDFLLEMSRNMLVWLTAVRQFS